MPGVLFILVQGFLVALLRQVQVRGARQGMQVPVVSGLHTEASGRPRGLFRARQAQWLCAYLSERRENPRLTLGLGLTRTVRPTPPLCRGRLSLCCTRVLSADRFLGLFLLHVRAARCHSLGDGPYRGCVIG